MSEVRNDKVDRSMRLFGDLNMAINIANVSDDEAWVAVSALVAAVLLTHCNDDKEASKLAFPTFNASVERCFDMVLALARLADQLEARMAVKQ